MIWSGKRTILIMLIMVVIIGLVFTSFNTASLQAKVVDQAGAAVAGEFYFTPDGYTWADSPLAGVVRPDVTPGVRPMGYTWAG